MRNKRELESLREVCRALNSLGITTTISSNEFDNYDIETTGRTGTEGVIEVKERKLSRELFIKYWLKEGFILESAKYYKLRDKNSIYLNIFDLDGIEVIIAWNLSGIKDCTKNKSSQEIIKKCPATSEFTDLTYIDKACWLIKRRTTTLRMVKIDGYYKKMSMDSFNNFFNL